MSADGLVEITLKDSGRAKTSHVGFDERKDELNAAYDPKEYTVVRSRNEGTTVTFGRTFLGFVIFSNESRGSLMK